jgi:hypothetical protein
LRRKENYIKLADGTIGQIPEEWIERYKHLFALGEETDQDGAQRTPAAGENAGDRDPRGTDQQQVVETHQCPAGGDSDSKQVLYVTFRARKHTREKAIARCVAGFSSPEAEIDERPRASARRSRRPRVPNGHDEPEENHGAERHDEAEPDGCVEGTLLAPYAPASRNIHSGCGRPGPARRDSR